MKNISENKKK